MNKKTSILIRTVLFKGAFWKCVLLQEQSPTLKPIAKLVMQTTWLW